MGTWCRFHTLPDSRRYAESESDVQLIQHRQVTLLNEVADGTSSQLIVLDQRWHGDGLSHRLIVSPLLGAVLWKDQILDDELYNIPEVWISFGPHSVAELRPLLRAVAEEELALAVTDASASWLYAPYDGGVDIFYPDEVQKHAARERHPDWLPRSESGL